MKQVLQDLRKGATEVVEVPAPRGKAGHLLIRSVLSLVSAGTERALTDFGRANLLGKALQQPEKTRQVLHKMKTDGLLPALEAVGDKLDQSLSLGYCNVGTVLDVGAKVEFSNGDRVVSNGKHAEVVSVPANLCAKIPDKVSNDEATFTVLGAIALQGIRLARPTLGETVVVTGLGLIGLLTVQLLKAHGCRVLAIDFDHSRLELAASFGAAVIDLSRIGNPVSAALDYSRGRGVDAVIIAASTTSNEPVRQAAHMCRKRGRIVLVGVSGLELERADFYEKELTFQVSCSYGPGRYDPEYEEKGHDYPVSFVRWTEQRNFEAILDMLADGRIDVRPLISHRFSIDEADQAYKLLTGSEASLGILLEYQDEVSKPEPVLLSKTVQFVPRETRQKGKVKVSFIGAGQYARQTLVPAFKSARARLRSIASDGGLNSAQLARKHGFAEATTDVKQVFDDPEVDAVVIATRHDSHAELILGALKAGKHVFVEKPLCLTQNELDAIDATYRSLTEPCLLMVGFNRRFAPHVRKFKSLLGTVSEPKSFVMTVNAGAIPSEHWVHDRKIGGGRIIGEGCHFVDLVRHLAGTPITNFNRMTLAAKTRDTASLQLKFADGSIGTVHYFSNGSRYFPKERLEVFCGGRILQLDNFRKTKSFGWEGSTRLNLWRQNKGQAACVAAFIEAITKNAAPPIPYEEIYEVAKVSIEIANEP